MIFFTQHSLLKLEQRGISKDLVVKALENPDYVIESYSDREMVFKKFRTLYLKVIFREEFGNISVITQYWTKIIK